MKHIIQYFINVLLALTITLSIIILFTEKTNFINDHLATKVINKINEVTNLKTEIFSTRLKWNGLYPNILLDKFILKDSSNKQVLESLKTSIEIDLFTSFSIGELSISSVVIDQTVVNISRNGDKILFNDADINIVDTNNLDNDIPLLVLQNSIVRVTDSATGTSNIFDIKKLLARYIDDKLSLQASFLHEFSQNPISIRYIGIMSEDSLTGQLYLSGNSVELPRNILPENMQFLNINSSSIRAWIDFDQSKIVKTVGNLSTEKINLPFLTSAENFTNITTDFYYRDEDNNKIMGLTRLNYKYKDREFKNNKIVFYQDQDNKFKIYMNEIQTKIITDITNKLNYISSDLNNIFPDSIIHNLEVHFNNRQEIQYYRAGIKKGDLNVKNNININNLDVSIAGNNKIGKISVDNAALKINNDNVLSGISGKLFYRFKGKSIYFSTTDLLNDQELKISFSGKKVSSKPSIRFQVSGSLGQINYISQKMNLMDIDKFGGDFSLNYFYHQGKSFSDLKLKNISMRIKDAYLSVNELYLTTLNERIHSNIFEISLNGQNYSSSIDTNVSSMVHEYALKGNGILNIKSFEKIIEIDKDFISGGTRVKSILSYSPSKKDLSLFMTSNLEGMSINAIPPFSKQRKEKVNFTLNYQHYPKKDYPLEIMYDKHNIKTKFVEGHSTHYIKSPWIRGFVQIPYSRNDNQEIKTSLEYLDTNFFESKSMVDRVPRINLVSKHLKTENIILDNVQIILNPKEDYVEISKFNFTNPHIKMTSSGKWFIGEDESTYLIASINSDDFGLALKSLGYPKIVRGGKLTAKLDGNWTGALNNFKFSSTKGKLTFKIEDGQITELDKGTQTIGQVLGLFSLSSIPKRLSLDFSDFFSRGLRFDNLDCDISLVNGIASTNKMNIIGSFGEMRLTGDSDLIQKTHDQVLIFIPDLSSTSLITGAVIGGPIGAAASIFYDKLLKEFGVDTNKLAGIEYSITGPWEKPKIKVTQSFKPITN